MILSSNKLKIMFLTRKLILFVQIKYIHKISVKCIYKACVLVCVFVHFLINLNYMYDLKIIKTCILSHTCNLHVHEFVLAKSHKYIKYYK